MAWPSPGLTAPSKYLLLACYHREDEEAVALKLFHLAVNAQHVCFADFSINGVGKAVSQGPGLWAIMTGSCADGRKPAVTIEFDFVWPDTAQPRWAAITIQVGCGPCVTVLHTRLRLLALVWTCLLGEVVTGAVGCCWTGGRAC